jgi:hypothetical protein
MRHLDLLSRLTGRALKDVCLHHRTSQYAPDSSGIAGVCRHPGRPLASAAGQSPIADASGVEVTLLSLFSSEAPSTPLSWPGHLTTAGQPPVTAARPYTPRDRA